jgi:hypothetical protein
VSGKFPGGFVTAGAPAGYSVAFNGSTDYLNFTNSANSNLSTGDFTVEAWVYPTALTSFNMLFAAGGVNNYFTLVWGATSSVYGINAYNGTQNVSSSVTTPINQWVHVAFVRISGTIYLYINGVNSGSGAFASAWGSSTGTATIGFNASYAGQYYMNGYISNFRVIKGTGIYTANFTPPTQLFPIANTQLLICQSTTLIDNSSNAFAITANGSAKVSNFTPFTAYTAGAAGFNPALGAAAPGVWTLDEAEYYQGNRLWPIFDPYFNQTTLMLHGNQPSGVTDTSNNVFKDSSTNNFTITRNGTATQGTFTPFSPTGWSGYFAGDGNYLTVPSTSAYFLSTNNFTFEFWYYPTSFQSYSCFGQNNATNATANFDVLVTSTGSVYFEAYTGSTNIQIISSSNLSLNTWNHIAYVRNGSTFTGYINGVSVGTATNSGTINSNAQVLSIGAATNTSTSRGALGYVSNVRLVNGTAVYTSNFTPPTAPLTAIANTAFLALQNNKFVDNSAVNNPFTVTGTPSVQSFSPFPATVVTPNTYSTSFPGSAQTGYLSIASNAAFALGSNSFTIEMWINPAVFNTYGFLYNRNNGGTNAATEIELLINSSGTLSCNAYVSSTQYTATAASNVSLNAWTHVAVVRNGTSMQLYINGTASGSATTVTGSLNNPATAAIIAGQAGQSRGIQGAISNFRMVNGVAVYTGNFTPSTVPLAATQSAGTNISAITGTQTTILTCQSSTLIDNSTNAFTITSAGNAQPIGTSSPFTLPTSNQTTLNAAYSTTTVGGSGYFNGSTDYFTFAPGTATAFGTGNFTVEAWVYTTNGPGAGMYIIDGRNSGQTTGFGLYFASGSGVAWFGPSILIQNATTYYPNTWYHIAYVKNGSTGTIYVNGVSAATGTDSDNYTTSLTTAYIGSRYSLVNLLQGYMQGLRVVKGTALYTSNFTPPTAPPTAVTNTSLLLNYTNAGIIDNTAKNDLVTVSTASISTAQSKWGGASLKFNGTTDYLTLLNSPNWDMGGGSYTIEFWLYMNTLTGSQTFVARANTGSIYATFDIGWYSSALRLYVSNNGSSNAVALASSISPVATTWTHIAVVRNGSTYTIYVNGVSGGSATDSGSAVANGNNLGIGAYCNGANPFSGYIDDLRITKGVARYIGNFTPPTSQLQDQ